MKRTPYLLVSQALILAVAAHASGQAFSIDSLSPTVTSGFGLHDDIFLGQSSPAPSPIPPFLYVPGSGFEVDALSFGRPLHEFSISAPASFSVSRGSFGVAGTASAVESTAGEESSDVYGSTYGGTNTLTFDGDGVATAPNPAVPSLSVAEPATFLPVPIPPPVAVGDVDALDMQTLLAVPGPLPSHIYFSIDAASAAGPVYGPTSSAADIYVGTSFPPAGTYDSPAGPGLPPFSPSGVQPYALEILLGIGTIPGTNDLDAVVVFDDGDAIFTPGTDIIAFSLAPGSSYIGMLDPISGIPISPGDILLDATSAMTILGSLGPGAAILHTAESIGLRTLRSGFLGGDDNLNALDLVIPEPATVVLLAAGALALALVRRRRA